MRILTLLILAVLCTPNNTFAQNNNRLSIQTGLFHCFFDDSPLLNIKNTNKVNKPFNGLLYNSVGLQYKRKLNIKNSISFEYMYYNETYLNVHPNLLKNVVSNRNYNTFNVTYERVYPISKFNVTYGGGVNYRSGRESIVVNYGYFYSIGFWESLIETRSVNDIGVNLRVGFEYSPLKWLTIYSKFDCLSFIYINDKKSIRRLQDVYDYKEYPRHFDLSWRFGIGFNFGK